MRNKKGSAVIVVIITAVVFLIYAASTYTDISHLRKMHEKYFQNIEEIYDNDYQYKITNI